jgi:2-phosphoglycolate phosphatase
MMVPLGEYAAVVFDFDGTLADSYAAIASSVNHVRDRRGLQALSLEEVKAFVGRGADYLLTNTVPGGNLSEDLAAYRAHHPTVMMPLTQFLPGAMKLLSALHKRGIKIGLCSNKPRLFSQRLLQYLEVSEWFDVILGPEDVRLPKPAPDMLLLAVKRLGLPAAKVLYVGYMVVDVETARAAGVCVWAVATGSELRSALVEAQPERLLNDLEEMVAEIEPLC